MLLCVHCFSGAHSIYSDFSVGLTKFSYFRIGIEEVNSNLLLKIRLKMSFIPSINQYSTKTKLHICHVTFPALDTGSIFMPAITIVGLYA